jgi:hypothetical protein
MKTCKWCESNFISNVSYQIYCSDSCRELATKEKISQRYVHLRRQKRKGKDRRCKKCNEKLSIYNDDVLCNNCNINPNDVKKTLGQIKGMSNDKSKRNR